MSINDLHLKQIVYTYKPHKIKVANIDFMRLYFLHVLFGIFIYLTPVPKGLYLLCASASFLCLNSSFIAANVSGSVTNRSAVKPSALAPVIMASSPFLDIAASLNGMV